MANKPHKHKIPVLKDEKLNEKIMMNLQRQKEDFDINKLLGYRMKMLREKYGISQMKMGKILGVTFQQIQKYENGENGISFAKYVRFCNYFGVYDFNFTQEDCVILLNARYLFEALNKTRKLRDLICVGS